MSLSSIMDSGADPGPPSKTQHRPAANDSHPYSKPASNPLFVKQEALASPAPAELAYSDRHPVSYGDMPPVGSALPPSRLAPRELPAPDEAAVEARCDRFPHAHVARAGPSIVQLRGDDGDAGAEVGRRVLAAGRAEERERRGWRVLGVGLRVIAC